MGYKTIVVQLDIDLNNTSRLDFAWEVARHFEAELIAFSAAEPYLPTPSDVDGSALQEAIRQQIEDIEDQLEALKSEFKKHMRGNRRASWREAIGDPTRFLALHARAADLLITGTNHGGVGRQRTVDPGELILSAGRPILFAADNCRPMTAENILIAWKDTRESRRAVVDALPFLVRAREVLVAAANDGDEVTARDGADDMVRFLDKHGVKARSRILNAGHADTTEALLWTAVEIGADLTVSGGYGHSRLREWVFGGVTRALLQECSINRMISN